MLEVAKAESGKAHEEAERREASLREMFAKQKARVDALNVEPESAAAASARRAATTGGGVSFPAWARWPMRRIASASCRLTVHMYGTY